MFYSHGVYLICIKPVLYSPGANLSLPDKLQRTPLKPSMQPYVQFPSRGSHILPTHVSQRCSQVVNSTYHHVGCKLALRSWAGVLDTTLCDTNVLPITNTNVDMHHF
jgi:hypothetical protein